MISFGIKFCSIIDDRPRVNGHKFKNTNNKKGAAEITNTLSVVMDSVLICMI